MASNRIRLVFLGRKLGSLKCLQSLFKLPCLKMSLELGIVKLNQKWSIWRYGLAAFDVYRYYFDNFAFSALRNLVAVRMVFHSEQSD
jgi:hypothetical protein